MTDRNVADKKAESFFEDLWMQEDPWQLKTSVFEEAKYQRQLELLRGRRYQRVLELGCGAGVFTRLLMEIADSIVAIDISANAITQARAAQQHFDVVDFRVGNIMNFDPDGERPWDLVVISETIYYIGWLYSFFDVSLLVHNLFSATAPDGRALMANTFGGVEDYLMRPWLIRTYRDVFLNVGYQLEQEEIFHGMKNGTELEVLISVFRK